MIRFIGTEKRSRNQAPAEPQTHHMSRQGKDSKELQREEHVTMHVLAGMTEAVLADYTNCNTLQNISKKKTSKIYGKGSSWHF